MSDGTSNLIRTVPFYLKQWNLLCLYLSQSQEDTLGNRLNLLFAVSGEQSHEASFTVLKQAVPQQFLMLEILRTNKHMPLLKAEDKALNSRSNQFMSTGKVYRPVMPTDDMITFLLRLLFECWPILI
jgi:hypothetical protein